MQVGSWVKINTEGCNVTCSNGHESGHRSMNGMIGQLVGDASGLCSDCKHKLSKFNKFCADCGQQINLLTWLEQTQHYYSVEFPDGDVWEFAIDELEIIGDGTLASVIAVAQKENPCVPV